MSAAQLNSVWGGQPDVTLADVTFPTCPQGAPGLVDTCVRVDVFRNQRANGSPLPAFFASLVGINSQGVRATATAQVIYGEEATTASCLLPFAIPDRWSEIREEWQNPINAIDNSSGIPADANYPNDGWTNPNVWDPVDKYDVVTQSGQHGGVPLTGIVDFFDPTPMTGTGYGMANDNGLRVLLKANNTSVVAPSYYYPIVLPDGLGMGGNNYRHRINTCTELTGPVAIGDTFVSEPGNMVGPTGDIDNLINADSGASWFDGPTPAPWEGHPQNSVAFPAGGPRLRSVATFDVENFMTGHRTARGDVTVTGFVGVFTDDFVAGEIDARITTSNFDASATNVSTNTESFLRDVVLVR